MSKAANLAQLVALQKLQEQRCQSDVSSSAKDRTRKAKEAGVLAEKTDLATSALDDVFASPLLCPDRMLLAAGHLAIAEDNQARGDKALRSAEQTEKTARKDWQEASHRSHHLAGRHRAERRTEDRRADDARQAEQLSLRAALSKGTKA